MSRSDIIQDPMRMRQSIKHRWVAALRSGRYPQLINDPFLCRRLGIVEYRYNVLGVLCDVMDIHSEPTTLAPGLEVILYDGAESYLTRRVLSLAGIGPERGPTVARIATDSRGLVEGYDLKNLSALGISFQHLADIIEDQL